MGCDIHSIGQVLKDDKWVTKIGRVAGDDRNYDSFAVLANVRNGAGFAGCDTGEGWPYISNPRGLPDDLELVGYDRVETPTWYWNFDTKKENPQNEVWMGDHSFSWLTLTDLENFVENAIPEEYEIHGVVDKEVYDKIRAGKMDRPDSWCSGVGGGGVVVVNEDDTGDIVNYTHVRMKWKAPAKERLWYLMNVIEELRKLAKEEGVTSDEIRFVFGFDS